MLGLLKRNRKNILLAIAFTLAFYLIAVPVVYLTYDFEELSDRGSQVLGVPSGSKDVYSVVDSFLSHIVKGDFEHIKKTTNLEGKVDFAQWHELKEAELYGDVLHESDDVALFRVDFVFFVNERNFEYPLTLVFVAEREDGFWSVNDIEYTLSRYNALLE
jgi:hypothetical protein